MGALPEGWESDYDGTRWFYTYKPTGHVQYHFPTEGDEFPDFIDAFAPVPVLAPEERLESRRQTTATGTEKTSTTGNVTKPRMSASARPIDDVWDEADDGDKNGATVFQPESFMYLGPGAYGDVSPLIEEEDEAAKRVVVGTTAIEAAAVKNISPVTSEKTTPRVAQSEPAVVPPQPIPTQTNNQVSQQDTSTPVQEASEPSQTVDQAQQFPPPAAANDEPAAAMIDGREVPHELPVPAMPRFDPVGVVAEMATEHTAAAYIEIHPDPVEMADNLVLAPIETAAPLGIAELPEKSSPVEKKVVADVLGKGDEKSQQQQKSDEPKSDEPKSDQAKKQEQPEDKILSKPFEEPPPASKPDQPTEEPASGDQPASPAPLSIRKSEPATAAPSSNTSPRKSIAPQQPLVSRPDIELHDSPPKDESSQQTLSHVPSVLKPVRHALQKGADQTPVQPTSPEQVGVGGDGKQQQSISKHPSVLQPARGRAPSQTAQQAPAVNLEQGPLMGPQGPQAQQQAFATQAPQQNAAQQQPLQQYPPQQVPSVQQQQQRYPQQQQFVQPYTPQQNPPQQQPQFRPSQFQQPQNQQPQVQHAPVQVQGQRPPLQQPHIQQPQIQQTQGQQPQTQQTQVQQLPYQQPRVQYPQVQQTQVQQPQVQPSQFRQPQNQPLQVQQPQVHAQVQQPQFQQPSLQQPQVQQSQYQQPRVQQPQIQPLQVQQPLPQQQQGRQPPQQYASYQKPNQQQPPQQYQPPSGVQSQPHQQYAPQPQPQLQTQQQRPNYPQQNITQHPQRHQQYSSQPPTSTTTQRQPLHPQASRPDMYRAATEPVQQPSQASNTPLGQPQQHGLLRPATVMPPLDYQPRLLPEQGSAPIQPHPGAVPSQQPQPSGLGRGALPRGQPSPNPPYPLSDKAPQFPRAAAAESERRLSHEATATTQSETPHQFSPQHQGLQSRPPMPQGGPRYSSGNVSDASLSSPSSISQSPGFPLHSPSPLSQTPSSPPHVEHTAASTRKPLARSASISGPSQTITGPTHSHQPPQPTQGFQEAAVPGNLPSPPVPGKLPLDPTQQQYFPTQRSDVPPITLSSSPSVNRMPVSQPQKISKRHSMPAQRPADFASPLASGQTPSPQVGDEASAAPKTLEQTSSQDNLDSANVAPPAHKIPPQAEQTTPEKALNRIEERDELSIPREASPLSTYSGYHTRRHSTVSSIQPPTYTQNTSVDYSSSQGLIPPTNPTQAQQAAWQAPSGQNVAQAQDTQHPAAQPSNTQVPAQSQIPQHGPVLEWEHGPSQGQTHHQGPSASQTQPSLSTQPNTHEWMSSQGLTPLGQLKPQQKQSSWTNYLTSSKVSGLKPTVISKNLKPGVASAQAYMENIKPGVASAQASMKNNLKPGMASAQTAINSLAGKSKDKFTKLRKSPKPGYEISAPQPLAAPAAGMTPNPTLQGYPQATGVAGAGAYAGPQLPQQGAQPQMPTQPNPWPTPHPGQQEQSHIQPHYQQQQQQPQQQYPSGPLPQAAVPAGPIQHYQQQNHPQAPQQPPQYQQPYQSQPPQQQFQQQHYEAQPQQQQQFQQQPYQSQPQQQQYVNGTWVQAAAGPSQGYQQPAMPQQTSAPDTKIRRKPPPGQGQQIAQPNSEPLQTQPEPAPNGPLNSHPVNSKPQKKGARNPFQNEWFRAGLEMLPTL